MIKTHWQTIWQRDHPTDADLVDRWAQHTPSSAVQLQWTPFTAQEFADRAAPASPSSAGPTGWSNAEIKVFPVQAWEDFTTLVNLWFAAGMFPHVWQDMTMVTLPKPGKSRRADGATAVDDMRPICMECALWRLLKGLPLTTG